jgi:hypothetical protein
MTSNYIDHNTKSDDNLKYINLDNNARFIPESVLRASYIKYSETKNPDANPYVTINDELELGIVNTKDNIDIAKGISSLLSRSINQAKDTLGGYLPEKVVERVQYEYVSPYGISNLWGKYANRFVLSKKIDELTREIIGTALITSSKETLLFFTSKYHNVRFSTIEQDVDFDLRIDDKEQHKWFDKFDMPDIKYYKPDGYNQLANFSIDKTHRGKEFGKLLITEIIKNYAIYYPKSKITHSQPLICSRKGIYQIADVSWPPFMLNIGFKHRLGAESFFIDQEWDPLLPVVINGKEIDNKTFNCMFGIPTMYENMDSESIEASKNKNPGLHLIDRIPKVIELANSGYAKLQYFQLICLFDEFQE